MAKTNRIYMVALAESASSTDPLGASWALLVEPKKSNKWFHFETAPASLVFESHGRYNDVRSDAFLLKVLLAENEIACVDKRAEETLHHQAIAPSQIWVRNAMDALRHAGLVDDDVDAARVMDVSTKALNKLRSESRQATPAHIDHLGNSIPALDAQVHKQHEKHKKKFGGMWVSYGPNTMMDTPCSHRPRSRNSWERPDDAYGGLM
ncbi:hypothetical protein AAFC00_006210 [Neodothiora populina]|uniref:Uncharacterized protein n=1 Tax=Neodothiora populina TaxID=2781224 RepID=A0ABR3P4K3_9PEZI